MTEKQLINLEIIGMLWLKVCSRLNEIKLPPNRWCELRPNLQRAASKGPDFCHVCVLIFCYCYVCRLGLLGFLCRSAVEVCVLLLLCVLSRLTWPHILKNIGNQSVWFSLALCPLYPSPDAWTPPDIISHNLRVLDWCEMCFFEWKITVYTASQCVSASSSVVCTIFPLWPRSQE